jgi:hypothetical protein
MISTILNAAREALVRRDEESAEQELLLDEVPAMKEP